MYSLYREKSYICSKCKKTSQNKLVNGICKDCIRKININTINVLCETCLNNCKQNATIDIIKCPDYVESTPLSRQKRTKVKRSSKKGAKTPKIIKVAKKGNK